MTTAVLSARGGSFARPCLKKRISESWPCAQSFKIVESSSLFVDSVIRIHVSMSCYRATIRNGVAADVNPLITAKSRESGIRYIGWSRRKVTAGLGRNADRSGSKGEYNA